MKKISKISRAPPWQGWQSWEELTRISTPKQRREYWFGDAAMNYRKRKREADRVRRKQANLERERHDMVMRAIKIKRRRLRRWRMRRRKILLAFSRRLISKDRAVKRLGLRDYAQLLVVMGIHGVPLPKLPEAEIEAMKNKFLELWRS